MKKRLLSGILLFGILCSVVSINFLSPSKAAAVGLPACLSDKTGLSEFDAVTNNTELVARLIFSEAQSESMDGKKGVAQVVINRQLKNLPEFGGTNVRSVVLKPGEFAGMGTVYARCPADLTQWNNSWNAASDPGSASVKVGKSLWFNTNGTFSANSRTSSGYLEYKFPGTTTYQRVVEKVVIGGHTFFRVSGY